MSILPIVALQSGVSAATILAATGSVVVPSTPHRYWRLLFPDGAKAEKYIQLVEVGMSDRFMGATLCVGGIASASSQESAHIADMAFDGNLATSWTSDNSLPSAEGAWIAYDFKRGVDVSNFWTRSVDTFGVARSEKSAILQCSDNGVDWSSVTRPLLRYGAAGNNIQLYNDPARAARADMLPHAYWRIRFYYYDASYVALREVAFLDAQGNDLCVGGTAAASSELDSASSADKAFDKNLATRWSSTMAPNRESWLAYHFATPVLPVSYAVDYVYNGPAPDDGSPQYIVESSDDGVVWVPQFLKKALAVTSADKRIFAVGYEPSYAWLGASGDRTRLVSFSTTVLPYTATRPIARLLYGGSVQREPYQTDFNTATPVGAYMRLDYGEGNRKRFTELRWSQTDNAFHGQWKVQASNDLLNWVDLSAEFTLGGGQTSYPTDVLRKSYYPLNLNPGYYRYVQLLFVSGKVSGAGFILDMSFKLAPERDDHKLNLGYGDPMGAQPVDRRDLWTMRSEPANLFRTNGSIGGLLLRPNREDAVLDMTVGITNGVIYFSSSHRPVKVTELRWLQNPPNTGAPAGHGNWEVEASLDQVNWISLGTFIDMGLASAGVALPDDPTTFGHVFKIVKPNFYSHYRMRQISGTTNGGPWLRGLDFNIDNSF